MSVTSVGDVDPKVRRRWLARALVRSLLSVTVLVAGYYLLPLDQPLASAAGVVLLGALLGVTLLGVWQVRTIVRSEYPVVRAIEALATSVPLFLLLFATTYYLLSRSGPAIFNQPLSRTDALYFTVTVFSTVGFGDIVPLTEVARVATMIQMVGDLLVLGVLLRAVVGAVRLGQRRKADSASNDNRSPG